MSVFRLRQILLAAETAAMLPFLPVKGTQSASVDEPCHPTYLRTDWPGVAIGAVRTPSHRQQREALTV